MRVRHWLRAVAATLALAAAAGCTGPNGAAGAELERLQRDNELLAQTVAQLKARVDELEALAAQAPQGAPASPPETPAGAQGGPAAAPGVPAGARAVDLIDPHYPPAVAGTEGWVYHKSATADLDGDGVAERVSVTNNAGWLPDEGAFAWDDGHPWHVYVEEPDGTVTHVFSRWVQLGQLDVMISEQGRQIIILQLGGASLSAFAVTYRGPGQFDAVELVNVGISHRATFNPSPDR